MALLRSSGSTDDTVVIFTSDNGPQPGAWADVFVEFFDGNGPFRGAKGELLRGRHPGADDRPLAGEDRSRARPATTSRYFPDVLPTVAELAGAADHLPKDLDGLSLVPTLLGKPGEQKRHEYLYWEAAGPRQAVVQQAVRWGDWKAIRGGRRRAGSCTT